MIRYATSFLVIALITASAGAEDAKKVIIRWHGQSFFDIESSKGTVIATDPHALEAYGRQLVTADLVLISHLHLDHTQVGVIQRREKGPEPKVIFGLFKDGKNRGEWNRVDENFKDIHIRSVGVYHDNSSGLENGKNTVFIITVDGLNIVHLGDLGHELTDLQIKNIGPVDVPMIPIGGVYTLNGSEAKKVVAQLKPSKYILPMHYGTKIYDDLLPADEFLDGQNPENVKRYALTNKLIVETNYKPKEPIIALLGWSEKGEKTDKDK